MEERCFTVDHTLGGRMAARALLEKKHRKIAVIAGPRSAPDNVERIDGFMDELAQAGIDTSGVWLAESNFAPEGGWDSAKALLESGYEFSAVFCANDEMATGVLSYFQQAGIDVPGAVSVLGYDDTHSAEFTAPRLASVRMPWTEMTLNGLNCLLAMHGNLDGMHAPGIRNVATAPQVCHHVLLSHGLAVPVIRANVPGAQVGIALSLHPVKPATNAEPDQMAVRRHDAFRNRWFLDPLYGRGYPDEPLRMLGQDAPTVLAGDMEAIAASTDFLGVNYYFPEEVRDDPAGGFLRTTVVLPEGRERTDFGWEVAPADLTGLMDRVARDYQPAAMYVTENGSCYDDHVGAGGSIMDTGRRDYLVRHLAAVRAAQAQGVPVKGISPGACWTTSSGPKGICAALASPMWTSKPSSAH